ncbi:MAG: hypothetical protein OXT49_07255 [Gammaproteobacteria bacterium]|nr:hypothetical protein [Gammaproteobacteria bacterium]
MTEGVDEKLVVMACAVFVSCCALATSIWQAYAARKHNRLSVTPHLTTWFNEWYSDKKFELILMNNGVGPAKITSFKVYVDGVVLEGVRSNILKQAVAKLFDGYNYSSAQSFLGRTYSMRVNESCELLNIEFHGDSPTEAQMEKIIRRLDIQIDYASMYEQSFKLSLHEEM